MDRFRDRFTMAGAKDDSRNAEVMAPCLRTDPRCFRLLAAADPIIIELREWSHRGGPRGPPDRRPLPAVGYPFLVAAFAGWIWRLLKRAGCEGFAASRDEAGGGRFQRALARAGGSANKVRQEAQCAVSRKSRPTVNWRNMLVSASGAREGRLRRTSERKEACPHAAGPPTPTYSAELDNLGIGNPSSRIPSR